MEKVVRKKRIIFIILIIALVVQPTLAIFAVLIISKIEDNYYENNIVLVCDSFYGYNLTEIKGEVREISLEDYNSNESQRNTITNNGGYIFPDSIFDGSLLYFEFSELFICDEGYVYRSEIYCEWKCPNVETYNKEIKRLSSIKWDKRKGAVRSNDLFPLPSFVAEFNYKGGFEYALFDDNNLTIEYIFLKGVADIKQIVFDIQIAPQKNLNKSDFPKEKITHGAYSMYVIHSSES